MFLTENNFVPKFINVCSKNRTKELQSHGVIIEK